MMAATTTSTITILRLREPASWQQQRPFRACELCHHGLADECGHPEVTRRGQALPVRQVRALGGACGPEANLMLGHWMPKP